MVDINIDQSLTQQFGQEERSQRKLHEKIFIKCLPENPADKVIVRGTVAVYFVRRGVGLEHLVLGQGEKPTVGIEG